MTSPASIAASAAARAGGPASNRTDGDQQEGGFADVADQQGEAGREQHQEQLDRGQRIAESAP